MVVELSQIVKKGANLEVKDIDPSSPEVIGIFKRTYEEQKKLKELKRRNYQADDLKEIYITI